MNVILYVYLWIVQRPQGPQPPYTLLSGQSLEGKHSRCWPRCCCICQNTAIVWIVAKVAPPRRCQEEKLKKERDGTSRNVHAKTFLEEAEKGQMGWEGKGLRWGSEVPTLPGLQGWFWKSSLMSLSHRFIEEKLFSRIALQIRQSFQIPAGNTWCKAVSMNNLFRLWNHSSFLHIFLTLYSSDSNDFQLNRWGMRILNLVKTDPWINTWYTPS